MRLPYEISEYFLAAADERVPGLIDGLYLHGSVIYGDFWPGCSDVDFVSVLSHRPDAAEVEALRDAHHAVADRYPRPHFDGSHLLASDLAAAPDSCPEVPGTLERDFQPRARFGVSLVTWHELADGGITVRGDLSALQIWTDVAALQAFSRENLHSYWKLRLEQLRDVPDEVAAGEFAVPWFVLGVTRLHHVLATGRQTSKTGAGEYALGEFDERWHPIVTDALRLRHTGIRPSRPAAAVARDNRDYTAMVIDSALAL
ncbi:MAG TPA: aminoglycoside adenylyltransferase domain-containing protein [Mycobacteriales bacterium]|nr:aminoglycoside adenylyltransferase domain-containing protein [Mycobacteriales bacterium]